VIITINVVYYLRQAVTTLKDMTAPRAKGPTISPRGTRWKASLARMGMITRLSQLEHTGTVPG